MKELNGRVAAITGGGSGIGRATAFALGKQGCALALADVNMDSLESVKRELKAKGIGPVTLHRCDVSNREEVERFASEVAEQHQRCDILVNNAGVTTAGRFEEEALADLEWLVGINLWGVIYGCRAFLPLLRQQPEAHIVNLSSMAGLLGLPRNAVYSMTKGAVRSFSEGLRAELRSSNIGVTMVHPGAIDTAIVTAARGSDSARLQGMQSSLLRPLIMRKPSAVANAILRGINHDRARVVVGVDAHLVDLCTRVFPSRSGGIGRLIDRFS